MPKQLYKITQFHGGLNSNSDARDIAENELSEATDVMVDELGKIRMMGGITAHKADVNAVSGWTGTLIAGYGLFYFSHDRTGAEDSGSSEAITGDNYLAIYDGNDGQVWIYSEVVDDAGGTGWDDKLTTGGGVIDIGSSNTSTAEVNFYAVDGAIRVCDGLHTNSNTPQWYGYVARSHFAIDTAQPPAALGTKVDFSTWVSSDQQMSAPTRGLLYPMDIAGQQLNGYTTGGTSATALIDSGAFATYTDADFVDDDYVAVNTNNDKYATISARVDLHTLTTSPIPGNWDNGDLWAIYPSPGTGFNLLLNWTAHADGAWPDAVVYEFAASFIYDDNQETELYYYPHTATSVENEQLNIDFRSIGNFDSRYTDFRLYYRPQDTGALGASAVDATWLFLAEVSLAFGARTAESGTYSGWNDTPSAGNASNGTTLIEHYTSINITNAPSTLTYALLSGMSDVHRISSVKYKTAVVANRRAYIGNVQYTDFQSTVQTKGDAVLKSPVNQFDVFGLNGLLEVSVNDGDNIVKLEAYADRLLIFKKNKLELLNISQEVEFLEDTFIHKGVSHPAATCKTDFGIAWVNKQGCYLYDGQRVSNLLEKGGRQIIKESLWAIFTTNEPMIGYISKKRQIIVADDITTSGDGSAFLYDMVTQSWIKGATATITDQNKTNFITDWNGDLVYAHTAGTVVKWDDAADSSTAMVMSTKDIDFGNPGQKKTVYKVIVTYTTAASGSVTSNVQLDYGVNGDTTFAYDFTVPELPAANGWQTAELVPDVQSEASNIKSFRLRFATDGTVPAGFEINDVSIVYRLKGAR